MSGPFHSIIGHERVIEVLERGCANNSLPHAFLFVGAQGVGRTCVAETLLKSLFDVASLSIVPDFIRVSRLRDKKTDKLKTQISVEQIRAFTARASLTAMNGSWKAGFIEEADKLSVSAANALLKTLEEPKGKTIMILRAPSKESVLETITSRCQIIRFYPVGIQTIADALVKRGFAPEDARTASELSFGRPGMALRFLKDGEYRAEYETANASMTQALRADIPERLQSVTDLIPKSEIDKAAALGRLLDRAEEQLRSELTQQPSAKVVRSLERLFEVRSAMKHNINPHLALEHFFL